MAGRHTRLRCQEDRFIFLAARADEGRRMEIVSPLAQPIVSGGFEGV